MAEEHVNDPFPQIGPEFLQLRVYTQERDFDFVDATGTVIAVPILVTYPGNTVHAQQMNLAIKHDAIQINFGQKQTTVTWAQLAVALGLV